MGQERLILVHGTGASEPGPAGDESWWQPESAFARELVDQLSANHKEQSVPLPEYQLESFNWSGANSESDRRKSGRLLARRLAALERDGQPYHIIGHSHGGSVIWHAFGAMNGIRPRMLKSWVTVGTPFLTFGDRGLVYLFVFLTMAIATSACVYLLGSALGVYINEYARVFRDAPLLATIGSIVGLLTAIGLAVYSVAGLAIQVQKRFISNAPKFPLRQIAYLGRRWLPILHVDDEPQNGLRASVVQPPEPFVARLESVFERRGTTTKAPEAETGSAGRAAATLAKLPRAALRFLFEAVVAPAYNTTVAPLVDQFLWETIKRVLQGNDVPGESLVFCDRVPVELERYWTETPEAMQLELSTMADAAAVNTAAAVRRHLVEMAQGKSRLSGMTRALSWKEIIHTSYFDSGAGLSNFIAEFTRAKTDGPTQKSTSGPTAGAKPRAKGGKLRRSKPYRPRLLQAALAILVVGLCAAATLSTFAIEQAWLRPNTNSFQMAVAADEVALSGNSSLRILPRLEDILMRMVLLDQTDKAIAIAIRLDDMIRYMGRNARLESLQNIAFAIGLNGSEPELAKLLQDVRCHGDDQSDCLESLSRDQVSAVLLVHAAAAGRLAGNSFEDVAGNQLKALLPTADPENWVRGHLVDVLLSANAFELADAVSGSGESACEGVLLWAGRVVGEVDYRRLPGRLSDCLTSRIDAYQTQPFYTYQNYFSAAGRVLGEIIRSLPTKDATACKPQIALATAAMDRCMGDRETLLPNGIDRDEPEFFAENAVEEMLTEISNMVGRWSSSEIPACGYSLERRLSDLSTCLRPPEEVAPPAPPPSIGASDTSPTNLEPAQYSLSWASTFWNDEIGTAGKQGDICQQDDGAWADAFGRTMQGLADNLSNLRQEDEARIRDSVTRRTQHELSRASSDLSERDDTLRCGWAVLGIASLRLGESGNAARLFDLILTDENAAQGGAMLDFHLGVADAASAYSPNQAKRFLDRSFGLVDEADASLFFQTSDGSVDDFFAYTKADISRLYAKIGEYRLAILASDRLDRLDDGKVAAYLNMLDAEIKQMGRYDDRTLDALKPEHRLPVYRSL